MAKKRLKFPENEEQISDLVSSEPKGKAIAVTPKKSKKAVGGSGSGEVQPSAKSGMKRLSEGISSKAHAKRAKKIPKEDEKISEQISDFASSEPTNPEEKAITVTPKGAKKVSEKKNSQRVWSEDDEIALLLGMIDWKTDTGKKEGFYESLKESISFDVTRSQFRKKIYKLEKKYVGKNKSFSNALSMRIWRPNETAVESVVKSNVGLKMSERLKNKNVESVNRELLISEEEDDEKMKVEDSKKPHVGRLWSEGDEIALLQGMVDSGGNMEGLYESLKESISFNVSKNQFREKIRKLKIKYMGKNKSFLNAHENKCFDLAMRIWGPNGFAVESAGKTNVGLKKSETRKTKNGESVKQQLPFPSPNGKKKIEDDTRKGADVDVDVEESPLGSDWIHKSFLVQLTKNVGGDEHLVKERWSSMPIKTRREMEKRWELLLAKELDVVSEKTGFLHELTSAMTKSS